MPTILDLLYVAVFAVVFPLWDHFVTWPKFEREIQVNPTRTKIRFWTSAIVYPWLVVAVGAGLWIYNGRPWASLGFVMPEGWRLWVSCLLIVLLALYLGTAAASVSRDPKVKDSVRQQMTGQTAAILPQTKKELYLFSGVSITAGFCEEFLYRGFFVWALSPWIGWWGAGLLALAIFALGHLYQGWQGAIRTGIVGLFFILVVAISGSLWPAIVLHAVLDLGQGVVAWQALREDQP